jgi:uncharacterized protein (TIGR00251 family)
VGVKLRVVPNARRSEVVGEHGEAVKVKVAGPAVDGKANAVLCQYVAECLRVAVRSVRLVAGEKSRDKVLEVDGMEGTEVRRRLLGGADPAGEGVVENTLKNPSRNPSFRI